MGLGEGLPAGSQSEPHISTEPVPAASASSLSGPSHLEEAGREKVALVPLVEGEKEKMPATPELTPKTYASEPPPRHTNLPTNTKPKVKVAERTQKEPPRNPSRPSGSSAAASSQPQSTQNPEGTGAAGAGEGITGASGGTGTGTKEPGGAGGSPNREFQLAQVDKPPVIITRVEPDYPYMARRQNLSGKVTVKFLVDTHGKVQKPCILKADPQGLFESCVLEALGKWRFKPGYYRGSPVATWVVLPIQFRLSG